MPAASAMSRTVVARNPRSAKSRAAMSSSSPRRSLVVGAALIGSASADEVGGRSFRFSRVLAAYRDDLAGEIGRVVAGEEDDHVGDLPRLGVPAERLALGQLG